MHMKNGVMCLQVHMLADQSGSLTKALGVELDLNDMLGNVRCKRYLLLYHTMFVRFNVNLHIFCMSSGLHIGLQQCGTWVSSLNHGRPWL